MEDYALALLFAIPLFTVLVFIEIIAAYIMKKDVIYSIDTVASLSSGITNILKDVLKITLIIFSYDFLYSNFHFINIKSSWILIVITFIWKDFVGYWVHRFEHKVNYFWNRHLIHHSSEEFNLACALRQSISTFTSIFTVFYLPLAIIGVPTEVMGTVAAIHLFAQFWYHTRLINRMGFLEHIIVTPSHHRVHHAINDEYLDKNFSQIFIIWDKWFGTFQEEMDSVPAVYGIKRASGTWNPVFINFQHLWLIIQDTWRAEKWKDKFLIWFMPTGWRPADVEAKYPVDYVKNPYEQVKYRPKTSKWLDSWAWIQMFFNTSLMLFLFYKIADIGSPDMYIYGFFVFFSVFSYSFLIDRSIHAWWIELLKSAIGIALIYHYGGWFSIDQFLPFGTIFVASYFILSAVVVFLFVQFDIKKTVR
ncbi:MAG: sterol desaturase family protein [Chitinophagales bacterium]